MNYSKITKIRPILSLVEEWESDALLDAHLASAHIQEAVSKLDGLIAVPPDIRRYRLLV